jgi:dTDP-4-dehydrorhamnose reductase
MQEKSELGVVNDQIGCPTSANSLAKFIWKLSVLENINSIYHWSDYGVASWYDFAVAIQAIAYENKLLLTKIPIKPIPASSYPTPAARPSFSLLNSNQSHLIQPSEHWTSKLKHCIKKLK